MAFNSVWTVISLDDSVSESVIRNWLSNAQLPQCIQFVFETPFEYAWRTIEYGGGLVPAPYAPWTILVSSDTDPRFNWTVYGLTWIGNSNCSIMFDPTNPNDTNGERGARMWHEMLHAMIGYTPPDAMKTSEFSEFSQYLIDTSSPHLDFISNPSSYDAQSPKHTALLIEFYTYLMKKYYPCECYGLCGDECLSNPCLEGCATRTCENCPGMEGCGGDGGGTTYDAGQIVAIAGLGLLGLVMLTD